MASAGADHPERRPSEAQALAATEALRAAVRALPAAVEAARLRDGSFVALAFGAALAVDVRTGAHGLELTLRPSPEHARAAAAELPGIVAAIRARGLAVARAEVRAGARESSPAAGRRAR